MSDDRQGGSQKGPRPRPTEQGVNGAGQGPRDLDRLPPPAFPPGMRGQSRARPRVGPRPGEEGEGVPDDAFISPDEPIIRSGTRIAEGAFIPPDAPLPRRHQHAASDTESDEEAIATGIGDDPHLSREELALSQGADPLLAEMAQRVRRLAEALRDRGEAGLRTTPEMSRFEATLRAYCVGYLAAQRETRSE